MTIFKQIVMESIERESAWDVGHSLFIVALCWASYYGLIHPSPCVHDDAMSLSLYYGTCSIVKPWR